MIGDYLVILFFGVTIGIIALTVFVVHHSVKRTIGTFNTTHKASVIKRKFTQPHLTRGICYQYTNTYYYLKLANEKTLEVSTEEYEHQVVGNKINYDEIIPKTRG